MRYLVFLLTLVSSPAAIANDCRAATAAQAGSEAGYNRSKAAADAWAQRQQSVTASLGDCLGNISTTITSPIFPNLSDWLSQIEQKICKAARDKINGYVPDKIDPWGDLPAATLSSYILQPAQPQVTSPSVQTPTQSSIDVSPAVRSPFISLN